MHMKKLIYNVINIVVLIFTAIWFVLVYLNLGNIFLASDFFSVLLLIVAVMLVHGIKAVRLYFALFGTDINFKEYLKIYCKVTPVSIVLPFKVGEIFRMYCYGQHINNYLKGIVIILMDRFMDTVALVSVMLLVWGVNGGAVLGITYFLVGFSVLLVLVYYIFPRMYTFWKQYLLKTRATKQSLNTLNMLEAFQVIYSEIRGVLRGRGVILYFLSLVAWIAEIGSIVMINQHSEHMDTVMLVSEYLLSAISGNQSLYMSKFVFISVAGLLLLYVILKFSGNKKTRKEDNR